MNRMQLWGLLAITGLAMGLAMPLGKLAVAQGVAPLSFVMLPALAAGLLLALLAWWLHGAPPQWSRLWRFGLVTGLLGNALPNTLTAWLSARAGASFSALAFTLPPLFTLCIMLLLGLERASLRRALAVGLGLAGALWLAGAGLRGGELPPQAALALLAIPAAIGAGNVYRARHLPAGVPVEWLGAAMSLGAFVQLLPVWWLSPPAASSMAMAGWPFLIAQVLVAGMGAVLFFQLQRRAEPVTMSFVGYAMALTAVAVGALALGERLPPQLLPAGTLILLGFWLVQRGAAPARPHRA